METISSLAIRPVADAVLQRLRRLGALSPKVSNRETGSALLAAIISLPRMTLAGSAKLLDHLLEHLVLRWVSGAALQACE